MAYESIKVDIIPGAENAEVLHFSQFDNKRPFFIELFNGADEFIPDQGMSLTLECRKRDGNIVIISDPVLTDNVAEFSSTEQLTACYGDNEAEIKIVDENDLVIGSANFIINVEMSPTCGGLVSESEIDNLTQQIEEITQEVIGEDYYTKTEVDNLLDDKADISDLPDMSQYYTKQQTDNLLDDKADISDLPDMSHYYTKQQTDDLLDDKADLSDLPDMSQYYTKQQTDDLLDDKADISDLPNMSQYYTKQQVDNIIDDIFPTFTASGAIASFTTALNKPLVSVTHEAGANTITRCGKNFWNVGIREGYIYNGRYYPSSNYWCTETNIAIKPNTTYTLQGASALDGQICFYDENNEYITGSAISARVGTFTTPNNAYFISVYNAISTLNEPKQLELGSEATAYEAYNGQTVPVADATTLTTLSGVNNVFADSGDVTVQYKYMSM